MFSSVRLVLSPSGLSEGENVVVKNQLLTYEGLKGK
jgi:hypothetical protein